MRIRKRQVPFLLSSLSPVPLLSDPHSSMVQLNPPTLIPPDEDDTAAYFNAPSSSHHQFQPIQLATAHTANLLQKDEREVERSNDTRSAKIDSLNNHEQSDSLHQVGKWFEGEKAFPLKKRRGSLETKSNDQEADNNKMKTKMNKKLSVHQNGNNNDDKESKEVVEMKNNNGKKRGRGGGLMEGSRCSRVNGRGWRCCQQTLVGYSLCEHHLGKGRLRSMTSVRSRSKAASSAHPLSSSEDREDHKAQFEYSEDDEKNNPAMPKKSTKTKLGIVKARSMSSLLGQQDNN